MFSGLAFHLSPVCTLARDLATSRNTDLVQPGLVLLKMIRLRLFFKHSLLRHDVVLRKRDHLIAKCRSDLLQRLVTCLCRVSSGIRLNQEEACSTHLWKVKVGDDEEEGRAADEDVVVILSDVGEGGRAGFGDCDVDLQGTHLARSLRFVALIGH